MNLTRHNYEEYFLLYIDNELEEEARRWVEQFVKENPDLEEVFHALQHTVLDKDEVYSFEEKDLLYQTTDEEHAARSVPLWRKWIPAIAASVLLLGAGAFWLSRAYRATDQGMVAAGRSIGTSQAPESAQTAGATQITGSAQTAGSAQSAGSAQAAGSAQSAGSSEGAVPAQSGSTQGVASTQNAAAPQGAHAAPIATPTQSIASTQSPSRKQSGTSAAAQTSPSTPGMPGTTPSSSVASTPPVVAIAAVPTQPTPAHTPVTPTTTSNDVAVNTSSPSHPDKNATGSNNAETKSTPSPVTIARTVSYHTLEDADQPNDGNKILFVRTDQVLGGGVKGFLRKASRLIKRSAALNSDNIHPETDSDNKTL